MTDEIIHIAGPVITFNRTARQRCAWCGALIQEYDLANIGVLESDRPAERRGKPVELDDVAWWEGLVAIDGIARWQVHDPADGKAPERSCMVVLPDGGDIV